MTIVKSVIFGNVSHYFGKKRESDGHTHGWTVFLRPFKNEVCNTIKLNTAAEQNLWFLCELSGYQINYFTAEGKQNFTRN